MVIPTKSNHIQAQMVFKFLSYYKFSSLAHFKCIQSFVKFKVNLCKIEFLLLMLKKPKNANMPKNDLT